MYRTCLPPGSPLPATHGVDDLDLVAVVKPGLGVGGPGGDLAVERHGRVLPPDSEMIEQPLDREAVGDLHRLAVHRDPHRTAAGLYPGLETPGEVGRIGGRRLAHVAPAQVGGGAPV